jgi:mono/diheme cytochrome c family protein
MRQSVVAFAIFAAACQQQTAKVPVGPAEITFDGAKASDAAARRLHGERLTHVLGCTGCHGAHLEGDFLTKDEPQYGPLYASNLTVEVPEYSDAQLDGVIRRGVHPTRKTVWAMPSEIFQHLSDADTNALIAYLRTLKPIGKKLPPPQFSKLDKEEIASDKFNSAVKLVQETRTQAPIDLGQDYALGRYITQVTCAECHGPKLEGNPDAPMGKIPNLVVAGAYTPAEFARFMVQGIASGNRKINPIMAGVARTRFAHFTPHERDALYAYLKARAQRP